MLRRLLFPPFAVASTLFFSAVAAVGGLVGAGRGLFDWVHRTWSRGILWAAGVELRVDGLEHVRSGGAQIFVSNHQSMLDIWALMAALPVSLRFVAKRELARIPVFAGACRAAGHVFIDRSEPTTAAEAIRAAGRRMEREGLSLVLFPEGTRSRDGSLGRFRRGSFALALETDVPLVPVAVDGGARALPPGSLRPRPGLVRVSCGEPIELRGRGPEERQAVLGTTRERILRMLEAPAELPPS